MKYVEAATSYEGALDFAPGDQFIAFGTTLERFQAQQGEVIGVQADASNWANGADFSADVPAD